MAGEITRKVLDEVGSAVGDIGSGVTDAISSVENPFSSVENPFDDFLGKYKWWVIGGVAVLGGLWAWKTFVPPPPVRVVIDEEPPKRRSRGRG
jgi:hypothetical protein